MERLKLRDYQQSAVNAILADLPRPGNSIVVIGTGGGKSLVIAEAVNRIGKPVLILQPSKEILEQNVGKMLQYVPRSDVGIFSASMNEKTVRKYTFATIQSIYKKPELFSEFRICFIDEADLLSPRDTDTMFRAFLSESNIEKVIGFTASPFRLCTTYLPVGGEWYAGVPVEQATMLKMINRIKTKRKDDTFEMFWSNIIFNLSSGKLMDMGFLVKPTYYNNSLLDHSQIPLNKSESDFDLEKYQELISSREDAILDAVRRARERFGSVLVFCASVEQAERFSSVVIGSGVLSAKTVRKERERVISAFRSGDIPVLFNYTVLGIGFDYPALKCIILCRPTRSLRMFYQFVGRGIRTAVSKDTCHIIDFSGTVKSLGRIETIEVERGARGLWDVRTEKGYWSGSPWGFSWQIRWV